MPLYLRNVANKPNWRTRRALGRACQLAWQRTRLKIIRGQVVGALNDRAAKCCLGVDYPMAQLRSGYESWSYGQQPEARKTQVLPTTASSTCSLRAFRRRGSRAPYRCLAVYQSASSMMRRCGTSSMIHCLSGMVRAKRLPLAVSFMKRCRFQTTRPV